MKGRMTVKKLIATLLALCMLLSLCALAEDVVVRYDFAAKTKIPLGDAIREKIVTYEASCEGDFPDLPSHN